MSYMNASHSKGKTKGSVQKRRAKKLQASKIRKRNEKIHTGGKGINYLAELYAAAKPKKEKKERKKFGAPAPTVSEQLRSQVRKGEG